MSFNKFKKMEKIEYSPYVPNYKKMGISPEISNIENNNFNLKTDSQFDNKRVRNNGIALSKNVPYAEASESVHIQYVPNIGNNIEHTWVGVDGNVIDDLNMNSDTDDYVTVSDNEVELIDRKISTSNTSSSDKDIGDYVVIYEGNIISSGSLDVVQKDVRDLIFGEHELSKDLSIEAEDLIVLKKISIKVGVFLE